MKTRLICLDRFARTGIASLFLVVSVFTCSAQELDWVVTGKSAYDFMGVRNGYVHTADNSDYIGMTVKDSTFILGDAFYSSNINSLIYRLKDGQKIWHLEIRANGFFGASITGMDCDANGNLFVCGTAKSDSIYIGNVAYALGDTSNNIYVTKIDPTGAVEYFVSYPVHIGSPQDLTVSQQGEAYICGEFYRYAQFGSITLNTNAYGGWSGTPWYYDYFVVKLDTLGQTEFALPLRQNTNNNTTYCNEIELEPGDQNFYLAGTFKPSLSVSGQTITSSGNSDIFLMRFTSSGQYLWGTHEITPTKGSSLQQLAAYEDGVFLTGAIGEPAQFGSINLDTVGTRPNGVLVRYDSSGNCLWVNGFGSNLYGSEGGSVTFSDSNVYWGILHPDSSYFFDTVLTIENSANYWHNSALAQLDWNGNYKSLIPIGSSHTVFLNQLSTTGSVSDTIYGYGNARYSLKYEGDTLAIGTGIAYLMKWYYEVGKDTAPQDTTPVDTIPNDTIPNDSLLNSEYFPNSSQLTEMYPNPTLRYVTVTHLETGGELLIISLMGEVLRKTTYSDTEAQIDMGGLAPGYYLLELRQKSGRTQSKVLKL